MKKKPKFDRTQGELAETLRTLRLLVREVGGNYLAGLQSEVARIEQAVRLAREDDTPDQRQLGQMTTMLRWIASLEVKPEKGRRRDLKELDKLIARLSDLVDNW
jgi:hypothetical protein